MAERKYFGTDGVRGKVGQFPITPDFALKLGWAAGKILATQGTKQVLIGKDTRISGYMLESALEAGLQRQVFPLHLSVQCRLPQSHILRVLSVPKRVL